MKRRTFLRASLQAGVLGALQGRARGALQHGRPNILWIMLDDCRPDALGCYGRPWVRTPALDRLAASGAFFENAVTQCPICVPSRTSMKTGLYCHRFGLMSMGEAPDTPPPYAYKNGAGNDMLRAWHRHGQKPFNIGKVHAFAEDWSPLGDLRAVKEARPDSGGTTYPEVKLTTHRWKIGGTIDVHPDDTTSGRIAGAAMEALGNLDAAAPWFLRLSFLAPHVPIEVPASFMVDPSTVNLPRPTQAELDSKPRFEREQLRVYAGTSDISDRDLQIARGSYYGMVNLVDHHVGRVLEAMQSQGLLENTMVVVNSDHGLQLGEHGLHKKRNFYDQTIKAPLVVSWPGVIPAGQRREELVEMVDSLPTLLDLSGLPVPGKIDGKTLVPLLTGKGAAGREAVFAEIDHSGSMYDELRHDSGRRVMVRTRDWKLEYFKDPRVMDPDGAMYDLQRDPGETVNLYGDAQHAAVRADLEGLVDAWDTRTVR
ncbi:MAG: sulfatase-like hydrolase/transferase [Candidatus Hydrogenedentes bacterium]|nr:sulfatase-like hydrolase/transferase [Candidatus Hydrogenedentota bacterium]